MNFLEGDLFKYFKNFIIGVGAAGVIIGALFKIMHWKYANEILIYSMCTEAFIFALQGMIPPPKDYYWENIYPGIDRVGAGGKNPNGLGIAGKLDQIFNEAKFDPNLIDRFGQNIRSLGDNVSKMNTVVNTAGATAEFSKQATEAAKALSDAKSAYGNAALAAAQLSIATEGTKEIMNVSAESGKDYQSQINKVSSNLNALNNMYESELKHTKQQFSSINQFSEDLNSTLNQLSATAKEGAKEYQQQNI